MKSSVFRLLLVGVLSCSAYVALAIGASATAAVAPLRVGAARVDVTPPLYPMANGMPEVLLSHLYVRVIVLDNGVTRAALINADVANVASWAPAGTSPNLFGNEVWSKTAREVAAMLGCPVTHIIFSAIHVHSDGSNFARGYFGPAVRAVPHVKMPSLYKAVVKAAREAYSHLRPAKVGFAATKVYLNVNRDAVSPVTHRWYQGPNVTASSDKTLAAVTFETVDGSPIAIYYDYAMHPINFFLSGAVSSDFPGAASRDLEKMFPGAVAVFVQGASGNQNPLYLEPHFELRGATAGYPLLQNISAGEYQARSNKFPGLPRVWVPSRESAVRKGLANISALVDAEGELIAQATQRAIRHTRFLKRDVGINGAQVVIHCPGRVRINHGRQGVRGEYVKGPSVPIRIGLLTIGPIALGTVDGEVYSQIAERLKAESPLTDTMMVTLANGVAPSGYIYDDASYAHQTFQVLSSRLEPGCAEDKIVNGILGLMPASLQ